MRMHQPCRRAVRRCPARPLDGLFVVRRFDSVSAERSVYGRVKRKFPHRGCGLRPCRNRIKPLAFSGCATGADHDCAGEQGRTGAGRAVTAAVADLSARDRESQIVKRKGGLVGRTVDDHGARISWPAVVAIHLVSRIGFNSRRVCLSGSHPDALPSRFFGGTLAMTSGVQRVLGRLQSPGAVG